MSFKVGDWVVRKAWAQDDYWPFGDRPVRINWLSWDGLELRVNGDSDGWLAELFDLYSECHTDADLAMALQLADLCSESLPFGIQSRAALWLRDQVGQELLNRGAR